MSTDESFEAVMKMALSSASLCIQCGECHAKTDVYIITRNLLDRLEAAWKRECELSKLRPKNTANLGQFGDNPDTLGNAAAMREALEAIRGSIAELRERNPDVVPCVRDAIDWIENWASYALSKPSRNCDKFATWKEASSAFEDAHRERVGFLNLYVDVQKWLFSTEDKGGAE